MPRYSTRPLPTSAYLPGLHPRQSRPLAPPRRREVDLDSLAADEDFRYGIDLYNHGFPWEAHEAWEPLWFLAPRERPERALLQGLIHAAAAVVKAKAGALDPARNLVRSALGYLASAHTSIVDRAALGTALAIWAHDPAQPPPPIILLE